MTQLSELLTIQVQDVCGEGVYLRWLNDYGGFDHYYFSGNIADLHTQQAEYFTPYQDELSNFNATLKPVNIDINKTRRVYAEFDKANKEAFEQLIRSRKVQRWSEDLEDWEQVGVQLESLRIEKMKPIGKIIIQIIVPKIQTTW